MGTRKSYAVFAAMVVSLVVLPEIVLGQHHPKGEAEKEEKTVSVLAKDEAVAKSIAHRELAPTKEVEKIPPIHPLAFKRVEPVKREAVTVYRVQQTRQTQLPVVLERGYFRQRLRNWFN